MQEQGAFIEVHDSLCLLVADDFALFTMRLVANFLVVWERIRLGLSRRLAMVSMVSLSKNSVLGSIWEG